MKRYRHPALLGCSALLTILLSTSACSHQKANGSAETQTAQALDLEHLDTAVVPGDDFYNYVNGYWQKTTTIPADRSWWSNFHLIQDRTNTLSIKALNQALDGGHAQPGSDAYKASVLYHTYLDTTARNRQGAAPLKPILNAVAVIRDLSDLQRFVIRYAPYGIGCIYNFEVLPDFENTDVNALWITWASTGMKRNYYVDADKADIREKYKTYMTKAFEALGDNQVSARRKATQVLALETAMQRASLSKEAQRNPDKLYNPMSVGALQKLCPAVDWKAFLKGIGAAELDSVVVSDPAYFKALSTLLETTPIAQLKRYLSWQVIDGGLASLSQPLYRLCFDFHQKVLLGVKRSRPLDRRALQVVDDHLGEALGKLYVALAFPPEARDSARVMVRYLQKAFAHRIQNLSWMSDSTKQQALKKLYAIRLKIGYPDKWKDYSQMQIQSYAQGGSLYQNLRNAEHWHFQDWIAELHKPVDRSKWSLNPQTVNAYYNPVNNEIVFPAAMLQPPFYDYKADPGVNFGAIGGVIGHEISHGFDDEGRHFDAEGNMRDWWTRADAKKFKEATKALIAQYNRYEALPGLHVNGTYTLGENIGDLGGINASYNALQRYLKDHPASDKNYDGFTESQRFFLSWATLWRSRYREPFLRYIVATDAHAPYAFRVRGPLVNTDAFYTAFDVKPGDSMYVPPSQRVRIW